MVIELKTSWHRSRTSHAFRSRVIQAIELHLLLSMMTPLGTAGTMCRPGTSGRNSQQDLSAYGFSGYPLLMSSGYPDLPCEPLPGRRGSDSAHQFTLNWRAASTNSGREPGFGTRPVRR